MINSRAVTFVSRNKKAHNLPDKKLVESFGVAFLKPLIKGDNNVN